MKTLILTLAVLIMAGNIAMAVETYKYVKDGDKIKIDTRDRSYSERVKE